MDFRVKSAKIICWELEKKIDRLSLTKLADLSSRKKKEKINEKWPNDMMSKVEQ